MRQTPIHEQHNPDLLKLIPKASMRLIEVGCSSGALAREFKKISPECNWLGIEIDAEYADLASRYCDESLNFDIEFANPDFWKKSANADCWIFGDTLEHLKDPWRILQQIRKNISNSGCIVACIPNAQHWSIQARMCIGAFRYVESGLLDKTHLRWFTRQTIVELFEGSGFYIDTGFNRIFDEPEREAYIPLIREMARVAGGDPEVAENDCLAVQYVIRAKPK